MIQVVCGVITGGGQLAVSESHVHSWRCGVFEHRVGTRESQLEDMVVSSHLAPGRLIIF